MKRRTAVILWLMNFAAVAALAVGMVHALAEIGLMKARLTLSRLESIPAKIEADTREGVNLDRIANALERIAENP